MHSEETLKLAAKWWKNRIKFYLDDLLKVAEADEEFHDRVEPIKDTLSKMDTFEQNLFKQLSDNKEDYITLSIHNTTYSPDLNCAIVNSDINIPLLFDITTMITSTDDILLIRYPIISFASMLKITDENSLIEMEDWS